MSTLTVPKPKKQSMFSLNLPSMSRKNSSNLLSLGGGGGGKEEKKEKEREEKEKKRDKKGSKMGSMSFSGKRKLNEEKGTGDEDGGENGGGFVVVQDERYVSGLFPSNPAGNDQTRLISLHLFACVDHLIWTSLDRSPRTGQAVYFRAQVPLPVLRLPLPLP
jgi:hypothetical protein